MIKDKLENYKLYCGLSTNIKVGFEWLISQDLDKIELKKHYINGEKFFANVQEYETKSDAKYEAHRKYIDIQYVINGVEQIGYTDINTCSQSIEYNKENDIEFLDNSEPEYFIKLEKGEFAIFFPNDAHKPSIDYKNKSIVKKIVVKVPID